MLTYSIKFAGLPGVQPRREPAVLLRPGPHAARRPGALVRHAAVPGPVGPGVVPVAAQARPRPALHQALQRLVGVLRTARTGTH